MYNIQKRLQKAYSYIITDKCNISLAIFLMVVLIISIILRIYMNNRHYEHFDTKPEALNLPIIQNGIGPTLEKGTINFPKPFTKIPSVFTQIIGKNETINNVYSVQVYNITTNSFDYSKNMVENKPAGDFVAVTLGPSNKESFTWIAFG